MAPNSVLVSPLDAMMYNYYNANIKTGDGKLTPLSSFEQIKNSSTVEHLQSQLMSSSKKTVGTLDAITSSPKQVDVCTTNGRIAKLGSPLTCAELEATVSSKADKRASPLLTCAELEQSQRFVQKDGNTNSKLNSANPKGDSTPTKQVFESPNLKSSVKNCNSQSKVKVSKSSTNKSKDHSKVISNKTPVQSRPVPCFTQPKVVSVEATSQPRVMRGLPIEFLEKNYLRTSMMSSNSKKKGSSPAPIKGTSAMPMTFSCPPVALDLPSPPSAWTAIAV